MSTVPIFEAAGQVDRRCVVPMPSWLRGARLQAVRRRGVQRQPFGQRHVGVVDVGRVDFVRFFVLRHRARRSSPRRACRSCEVSGVIRRGSVRTALCRTLRSPTGGVVGGLVVFAGGRFRVRGRRSAARRSAGQREEVFFASLPAWPSKNSFDLSVFRGALTSRSRAVDFRLRSGRCRFRSTRGSRPRARRGGERRFVGVADMAFEQQVYVFDTSGSAAFDVDAEEQRQSGFLGQVVDVAVRAAGRAPGAPAFDVGLQFDEAGFGVRRAGFGF